MCDMRHRTLIVVFAIVAAFIGWASAAADDTIWAGLPPPSGSLTVTVAGLDDAQTRDAIRTWNAAVGWDLFALATTPGADVVIAGGDGNYARPSARLCEVTVYNNAAVTISHELGHCLGLADHLAPSCEPEAYRGLMSYCTVQRINGADLAALRRLGYRTICAVAVQNGGPLSAVVTRGACSVSDVLARTNAVIVWALVDGRWEWGPLGTLDDLIGTYALYAAGGTE